MDIITASLTSPKSPNTTFVGSPKSCFPPSRCHYFDAVVGLAWSCDLASYAGGSVASGRISHAGQVRGDDSNKKGYPGPPVWLLGVGLITPPLPAPFKKDLIFERLLTNAAGRKSLSGDASHRIRRCASLLFVQAIIT
jgi:hypothetical protein